jgi:hypothetical protein
MSNPGFLRVFMQPSYTENTDIIILFEDIVVMKFETIINDGVFENRNLKIDHFNRQYGYEVVMGQKIHNVAGALKTVMLKKIGI